LRYHGAGAIVSQLLKDEIIEAQAIQQLECFKAGVDFARAEGILSAPEATHGLAAVVREANRAREEGVSKTILFNMCGHGHFDMKAYEDYFAGRLHDHELTEEQLTSGLKDLDKTIPVM
jgi:tryptophan synthase beta chain